MTKKQEALVISQLRLVQKIASAIHRKYPLELEDLISEGYIGLVKAARKFDAKQGASFRTFAGYAIHGAILDYIRKEQLLSRYEHKTGGVTPVREALRDYEDTSPGAESQILQRERQEYLTFAIRQLPYWQRMSVTENHLLCRRQKDIAAQYAYSESRISQFATNGVKALKDKLAFLI